MSQRSSSSSSSSSSNNNMHITASSASNGTGGAALHITEECERLFCETLRVIFLGERDGQLRDSLVMGSYNSIDSAISGRSRRRMSSLDSGPTLGTVLAAGLFTPPPDKHVSRPAVSVTPQIVQWLEIYDYTSDARFRGFIATNSIGLRSLFIFFEHNIVGKDLKQALMALIELASTPALPPCDQMVVCFDRQEEETPVTKALLRDLGWIGFELSTLKDWAEGLELTSSKWLFVAMDV